MNEQNERYYIKFGLECITIISYYYYISNKFEGAILDNIEVYGSYIAFSAILMILFSLYGKI
jgi:hypothetical protein